MAEVREQIGVYYSVPGDEVSDNISLYEVDLESRFGPKRQTLATVIPITVAYSIIFIAGLAGNLTTCIVIVKNKYMHTATNYYLFSLAIADLLVLILGLPTELYSLWSAYPWLFGEAFCLIRNMAAETSTYAAILTITAFTIERYVAICHPMRAQTMSNLSRAVKIIAVVWTVAALFSLPQAVQFGLVYVKDRFNRTIEESVTCNLKSGHEIKHTFEICTFVFFLTPMAIISCLYGLMAMAIRRSTVTRGGSSTSSEGRDSPDIDRHQRPRRARRSVVKMLVAVVVAFFVCWAPFHAQRLMVLYVKKEAWTRELLDIQRTLFYIAGVLYYISSTINPILYNIMSLKFRKAFRETIWVSCKDNRRPTLLYSYTFSPRLFQSDTKTSISECCSPGPIRQANVSFLTTRTSVAQSKGIYHSTSGLVRTLNESKRPGSVTVCTTAKSQPNRIATCVQNEAFTYRFPARGI